MKKRKRLLLHLKNMLRRQIVHNFILLKPHIVNAAYRMLFCQEISCNDFVLYIKKVTKNIASIYLHGADEAVLQLSSIEPLPLDMFGFKWIVSFNHLVTMTTIRIE